MNQKSNHGGTLSPEMALLGLLFGGPGHGYELHRKVNADLGRVWHLSQSQAYGILKRLQAQGDISVEDVPQEKLPPRRLMRMTPVGRSCFLDWLASSSGGSARVVRLEFITRLYFLRLYFPERVTEAVNQQRAEAREHMQRLEKVLVQLPGGQIYDRMSVEMRLKQLKAGMEWLDECELLLQPD
jgi:DNA-binding PadR family transcriptional regulator